MRFFSLAGREYNVDIRPSKWPRRTRDKCKSYRQWQVGEIIAELWPHHLVLEEFSVPGEGMFLDFFMPRKRYVIEVNGEQHYKYNEFFHGTREAFLAQKERDRRKELWCATNMLWICYIRPKDSEEQIIDKLKLAF